MLELKITDDGSPTFYSSEVDEHYHSMNGAVQESRHVFIEAGLHYALRENRKQLNILEIGFGTGLNCLLTAMDANEKEIHFTSVEKFPVDAINVSLLQFSENPIEQALLQEMHTAKWNESLPLRPGFTLEKIHADFTTHTLSKNFDLVYFDAFSPEKQPEMWTEEVFKKICDNMNEGGILVTYCAKGIIKRKLKLIGFRLESLPGPPGKREMIRAIKQ